MQGKNRGRLIGAGLAVVVGIIYLLNPGFGAVELIPDVIPWIGNLDEAGATALLIWGLTQFRSGGQADAPMPIPPATPRREQDQP